MSGYTRRGPDRHDRKEIERTQIDRWPDNRTGRTTTVMKEPDGRNDIRNEPEARQPRDGDEAGTGRTSRKTRTTKERQNRSLSHIRTGGRTSGNRQTMTQTAGYRQTMT